MPSSNGMSVLEIPPSGDRRSACRVGMRRRIEDDSWGAVVSFLGARGMTMENSRYDPTHIRRSCFVSRFTVASDTMIQTFEQEIGPRTATKHGS